MDIFKKILPNKAQKQSQIDAEEAHRLWTKTQTRYIIVNNIKLLNNFVHDQDFKKFLNQMLKGYSKQINTLETQLDKYSIKSPEPSKTGINAVGNSEIVSDQEIARTIYSLVQLTVGKCLKTLRDTTFNDSVREILINITKEEVDRLLKFVNYIDSKGWMEYPPLYPNNKSNEIIGANEIWELWQHLNNRYLYLQLTKVFSSYAADADLQALFILGNKVLTEQANKLEETILKFGGNLPDKQPKNVPTPESKEKFDDKYMFQLVLDGIKNATTLYGFAVQELVVNKDLQTLFKELLFDEIDYIDKLIKYGKVKGWVSQVPIFRP